LRIRRTVWIALLAGLAFAGILVARFPAVWAAGALPPWLSCDDVEGTVWNGTCTGLTLRHQQAVGDLAWQLHPLRLLAARLAAHVQLTQGTAFLNADVEWGPGHRLLGRDVHARFELDPQLLPALPANLTGGARADLAYIEMKGNLLTDLRGRIEVHDLMQHQGAGTPLGSYSLSFPGARGGGELVGELQDLGGPLALAGTVRMTPEPGFLLDGKVATRASVTPDLAQQLQILGAPDAQGRRSFSIANTF
jgi:Type II secretion system (T2SS), protein N